MTKFREQLRADGRVWFVVETKGRIIPLYPSHNPGERRHPGQRMKTRVPGTLHLRFAK